MERSQDANRRLVVRICAKRFLEPFSYPQEGRNSGRQDEEPHGRSSPNRGDDLDRWKEPVPATGNGLDEHRLPGVVAEGGPDLPDAVVEALVERDVGRWISSSPDSGTHWNAEVVRDDDTGRRFWAFVTTAPLTLITLANLFAGWRASGPLRQWWLAAAVAALADRVLTFSYFIPTMIGLMGATDSPESVAGAIRWSALNYVRHALVLAAWLASLKAFSLFHQSRG